MDRAVRLLILQDSLQPDASAFLDSLRFSAHFVQGAKECIAMLRRSPAFDLILMNLDPPAAPAFEVLLHLRASRLGPPVAMMCNYADPRFTFDAIRAGVRGFLATPVTLTELEELTSTLCLRPAATEAGALHIEDLGDGQFFLASTPAMLDILHHVRQISRTDVPVLITGETGVGKEVVVDLLHKQSLRSGNTFLKVNCAALPDDLLESELFGCEAGAFTGAVKSRAGKFDICNKGTILLDEIGEMRPPIQAKLLHVLQDGTFSRLGARLESKVDVRVLAATNINIHQAIDEKRFREDLYYRLNVICIHVPPLRERSLEIPWLIENLAGRIARDNHLDSIHFSREMISAATRCPWRGNLRELGNFVKRYLILRDETAALVELESKSVVHQPSLLVHKDANSAANASPSLRSAVRTVSDETEIRIIRQTLDDVRWNRRIAAERLQISYRSLLNKIRFYDLASLA